MFEEGHRATSDAPKSESLLNQLGFHRQHVTLRCYDCLLLTTSAFSPYPFIVFSLQEAPVPNQVLSVMTKNKERSSVSAPASADSRTGELFLDTVGFVIDNMRDSRRDTLIRTSKEWKTTANRLQLVSLEACRAWRDTTYVNLNVTDATPPWLWKRDAASTEVCSSSRRISSSNPEIDDDSSGVVCGAGVGYDVVMPACTRRRLASTSRVPKLRVTRMTWERSSPDLSVAIFPRHLRQLIFHWAFNQPIDGVLLPEGLEELEFRGVFDKPLPATLPQTIKKISFGLKFNQPVHGVRWPSSLRQLAFGHYFDQSLDMKGALPASLKIVHFGQNFRKSLSRVQWPDNLEEISLSSSFSEPLREVSLPQGLRRLTLAGNHVGQLDAVKWPPSITTIHLGGEFNQPIDTAVVWPTSLQQLSFGFHFNQAVNDIVWPTNLKELSFGESFLQPVESVILPDRLGSLAFLHNSSQPIQGLTLPTSLKTLTVGRRSLEEARSCVPQRVNILCYEFFSLMESL